MSLCHELSLHSDEETATYTCVRPIIIIIIIIIIIKLFGATVTCTLFESEMTVSLRLSYLLGSSYVDGFHYDKHILPAAAVGISELFFLFLLSLLLLLPCYCYCYVRNKDTSGYSA
jgi:hypothetical protein